MTVGTCNSSMEPSNTHCNLSCMQVPLQALSAYFEASMGAAVLLTGWSTSHLWWVMEEWLRQVQAGRVAVQHMLRGGIPQAEGEQHAAAGRVQAPGIVAEQQLVLWLHFIPADTKTSAQVSRAGAGPEADLTPAKIDNATPSQGESIWKECMLALRPDRTPAEVEKAAQVRGRAVVAEQRRQREGGT